MRPNTEMVAVAIDPKRSTSFEEDAILVSHAVAGDNAAFDRLYRKYYEKVFSVAKSIVLSQDEAADATQEIFTLVYRNLSRFDRRSRFSTWLFRIAVNRSIQESRSNRKFKKSVELTEDLASKDSPVDSFPDPGIHASLSALSAGDRAILTLFYLQGLSLNEIAESMDCSPNAAKTRLYRARERFSQVYEGDR